MSATASLPPAFNPLLFLQQLSNNLHVPQQPQIVVELRADKIRKSEAKFNNNMLQLLLIGGNVDITNPRVFCESPHPDLHQGNEEYHCAAHFGATHSFGKHSYYSFGGGYK